MKTNFTHAFIIRIILFILICLYSFLVFGQPGYDVQGATHKIETALQVNAKHRFNNVLQVSHANETIKVITGSLTLLTIDNIGPGFNKTFQPTLTINSHANYYGEELKQDENNTRISDFEKLHSRNYITNICTVEKNK